MFFLGNLKLYGVIAPGNLKTSAKANLNEHDRTGNVSIVIPNGRKANTIDFTLDLEKDLLAKFNITIENLVGRIYELQNTQQSYVFASGNNSVWNKIWGKFYIDRIDYTIHTYSDKKGVVYAQISVGLKEAFQPKKTGIYTTG